MIICPVCNREQNHQGIWIAVEDKDDDPDLPNYYMCQDCYERGRQAYRESIKVKTND